MGSDTFISNTLVVGFIDSDKAAMAQLAHTFSAMVHFPLAYCAEFPSVSTLARSLAVLRDYERSRSITASKRPKLKHVEDGVQSLSTRSAASTSWRRGYQTEVWQVAWVCSCQRSSLASSD